MYKDEIDERDYIEGKKNYYWHIPDNNEHDEYDSSRKHISNDCDEHDCNNCHKHHCNVCHTGSTGATGVTGATGTTDQLVPQGLLE